MKHLSRIIAYKIVYPTPHNRPRVSSVFYNAVRYLLWVACMGTHSDEDTHTRLVSIQKYDLRRPIFPDMTPFSSSTARISIVCSTRSSVKTLVIIITFLHWGKNI